MKKALFTAAIACLFGGFASAVTFNWSPSGNASTTIQNVDFTKDITLSLSYTIGADFSIGNGNPAGNIFVATWNGDASLNTQDNPGYNYITFRSVGQNPRIVTNGNGDNAYDNTTQVTNGFSEGTHTLVITLNVADKTGTFTFDDGTSVTIGFNNVNEVTYGDALDLSVYDRTSLTYGDVTVTYASTIPEPTALALLALGVAGVALRRRVA